MCTHNQCFEQKKEKYYNLKINMFTVMKYCCILHGRVCVMTGAHPPSLIRGVVLIEIA